MGNINFFKGLLLTLLLVIAACDQIIVDSSVPGSDTPDVINFQEVALGSVEDRFFTLNNPGPSVLKGQVKLQKGDAFTLLGDPNYLLAPGTSKRFSLRFMPSEAVAYSDNLIIGGTLKSSTIPVKGVGLASRSAYANQRLYLSLPAHTGLVKVSVNGQTVQIYEQTATSISFDLNVDPEVDQADILISTSGQTLVNASIDILPVSFASSSFHVFLRGISKEALRSALDSVDFSLIEDSYTSSKNGDNAIALIDIGRQSSQAAQKIFLDLEKQFALQDKHFVAGPNFVYTLERPARWTSPHCSYVAGINSFASGWSQLTETQLLAETGASAVQAAGVNGEGIVVAILDTLDAAATDLYECEETPEDDLHGSHIAHIIQRIAPGAELAFYPVCDRAGRCTTRSIGTALFALQDLTETGRRVIANLSVSVGLTPGGLPDRSLHGQLADFQTYDAPVFLAVAAAGNHGIDPDPSIAESPAYPASFSDAVAPADSSFVALQNILSTGTAGMTSTGNLAEAGLNPVGVGLDVLALGVNLCLSTLDCASLGITGSSYATALSSGLSALLWQQCSELTGPELRTLLKTRVSPIAGSAFGLIRASLGCGTTGEAPNIESFAASKDVILLGDSLDLSWDVNGTEPINLSLSPDSGNVTGNSLEVNPSQDTTYTLTAENAFGTTTATLNIEVIETAFYLTDAFDPSGGQIYKLENLSPSIHYTRPNGRIYHVASTDSGDLYFSNANDFTFHQLNAGVEESQFNHTTYLRDIVIDAAGDLYFSEDSGAGGDAIIYKLNPVSKQAEEFFRIDIQDVGFCCGGFAFDDKGDLWFSSGNITQASLYNVALSQGETEITSVYTAPNPIYGFVFDDGNIIYADWQQSLHHLRLSDLQDTVIYTSDAYEHLSDIAPIP